MIVCEKSGNYSNSRQENNFCVCMLCIGKEVAEKRKQWFGQVNNKCVAAATVAVRLLLPR